MCISAAVSSGRRMAEVIVYSTSTCPFCFVVKDFLRNNGVKFREINVAMDRKAAEEMVQLTGQMGVPVTRKGGDFVVGFDEPELRRMLKIK